MSTKTDVLFPPGRLVQGSMTVGQTTDAENRPLLVKSGPNTGQPRVDYFFAVAIEKKAGEASWAQTPWGQIVYQLGVAAFPAGQHQLPTFAWKVKDGDSQIPNKKGKKPCDQEGYKGCWVVYFSSGFAPKTYDSKGVQQIDPASIKLGHYVEVFGSVGGNDSQSQPGIFINHKLVAHAGFGPEISIGADASAVGFGGAALPVGATAAPVGALPGVSALPGAAAVLPGMAATPATVAVVPNPAILNAGGVPKPPGATIPAVPTAPLHQMTAAAGGGTYEQFVAEGWTDALLIQNGFMLA
jgi:hypothetical protein